MEPDKQGTVVAPQQDATQQMEEGRKSPTPPQDASDAIQAFAGSGSTVTDQEVFSSNGEVIRSRSIEELLKIGEFMKAKARRGRPGDDAAPPSADPKKPR